jgi:ribosomal protein S18 acetylase RimI-like enzyme
MSGLERGPKKEALPEISIERYTETDKEALIAGFADIQEVERALSDTRRPGNEMAEEYFEQITKEVAEKSGAIFMAKSGGKTIGFIACWIEHEADPIRTSESNTFGYISDAWVSPELRDRGLFGKLNAEVENYLKQFPEVHFVRLNVVAGNERAQAAYAKMGYAPEQITMAKRIAPKDSAEV